jgi:hypothetical protein
MSRTAARTLTLIIILGVCSPAWAQTGPGTFSNLGRYLKAGDTVLVVEREQGSARPSTARRRRRRSASCRYWGQTDGA